MRVIFIICLLMQVSLYGQELLPPAHIKTLQFYATEDTQAQFPIVTLGQSFTLSFDDLQGNEADYYYTLTHCDYQWKPSGLLKSEYLKGLDDVRITDYKNSYATLQPYTHYRLTLPNEHTDFLLTGNYLLTVTDSEQHPVFTRRFIIYSPTAQVQLSAIQSRDVKYASQKQTLQFKITSKTMQFLNPDTSVKVCILQNYQWHNAKQGIKPQYILGNELVYKYDQETSFWGGNEYLFFESRDLRSPTSGVYTARREGNQYVCQLFTQPSRAGMPYTYAPDIDGNFRIVSNQGREVATEAEYALVFFSLQAKDYDPSDEVYVYGHFSDNALIPPYQLTYNAQDEMYVGSVYLKQGFYNYKYARKRDGVVDYNAFSGNHSQTENNYTLLVYYRSVGDLYDRVIGVGSLNTTQVAR